MWIFLFLLWTWRNWSISRHIYQLRPSWQTEKCLNDQQSEVLVNHPVKGRQQERVTYTAIKKKKEKKLSVYFPRQISKQFHLFCAGKRNREICLTLMIWGLSLFWKSYNIWRPLGRIGHLSFDGGEEPGHKGTNQPGQYSKKGNPPKTLTILTNIKYIFGKSLVLCAWLAMYHIPNLPSNDGQREVSSC